MSQPSFECAYVRQMHDRAGDEFVQHMREYKEHPENYPYVEYREQWYLEYNLAVSFKVPCMMPLPDGRKDAIEEEECAFRRECYDQLNYDTEHLTINDLEDKYHLGDVNIDLKKNHIGYVEFYVTCANCGAEHVYGEKQEKNRMFLPLSYDLDYWICDKCGQTHSVKRRGM